MSRRNKFSDSAFNKLKTYNIYVNDLMEKALSKFQWNLPLTVDRRFLENQLIRRGEVVFFKDEFSGDYFVSAFVPRGTLDLYGNPSAISCTMMNGATLDFDNPSEFVIIRNTLLSQEYLSIITNYAGLISEIEMTIAVNVNAQKTPVMLLCDDKERLSMLNLYKEYEGGAPFIFGSNKLQTDKIRTLSTGANFIAPNLQNLKETLYDECLTKLGIINVKPKKERMISGEIEAMRADALATLNSSFLARKQAIDEIKNKFNLEDVGVKINE